MTQIKSYVSMFEIRPHHTLKLKLAIAERITSVYSLPHFILLINVHLAGNGIGYKSFFRILVAMKDFNT